MYTLFGEAALGVVYESNDYFLIQRHSRIQDPFDDCLKLMAKYPEDFGLLDIVLLFLFEAF